MGCGGVVPGRGGQRDEQSLEDSPDVNDWAFLGDEEVHAGQNEEPMQDQTHHHGDGVKS